MPSTLVAPPVSPALEAPQTALVAPRKPHRYYRPELDCLRLVAFLCVFCCHSSYSLAPKVSAAGGFGLCLFFLLSAFLITELLQREVLSTGTVNIKSFYIRRSLRIWPLYYGFLLASVLIGVLSPLRHTPGSLYRSYAFMLGNVYFGRYDIHWSPVLFLWSISVEEQFYLFWPWLNKVLRRRGLVLVALGAFPLAWLAMAFLENFAVRLRISVWSSSFVQFQFFTCGALLSLGLRGRIPSISGLVRSGLLLTGFLCWAAAARWSGVVTEPHGLGGLIWGYLAVAAGCTAVFLACYGLNARWMPAPLVYLGKISFGLYIFHKICLETVSALLGRIKFLATPAHHHFFSLGHIVGGFGMTVLLAALSYHFYELPFLTLKDRFAIVPSRAA